VVNYGQPWKRGVTYGSNVRWCTKGESLNYVEAHAEEKDGDEEADRVGRHRRSQEEER
jgi:hypothetical protein